MKKLTKILTLLLSVIGINYASAQCPPGQVDVTIDIATDTWGYETYWELVPQGNACGTGTLFSGGNTAVGCGGEGLQAVPNSTVTGGYAVNTTITEGPFCVTDPSNLDLIIIDDWGDGGNDYTVTVAGNVVLNLVANDAPFYAASAFDDLQAANPAGEYTLVPQTQAAMLNVTADIVNGGTNNVTDAILTCKIYEAGALVNTLLSAPTAVNAGATSTISLGTHNISTIQSYTFEYVVTSATVGADVNVANDTTTYAMATTDSTYARDNVSPVGSLGFGAGSTGVLANKYTLTNPATLNSVTAWVTGLAIGDTTRAVIYNVAGGVPTTIIDSSAILIATAADTGSVLLQLPMNTSLVAGDYVVGIEEYASTANIRCVRTSGIITAATSYFKFAGGAWTDGATQNFPQPYVIRPNLGAAPVTCNVAVTVAGNGVTTTGGSNGDATATVTGGQSNITYVWSNGGTTGTIATLTAGTYTVTVSDDILAGCTATATVTITEPAAATCNLTVTNVQTNTSAAGAADGTATAVVTGGQGNITYNWSNGNTTMMTSGLTAGTYTVSVSDDVVAGCMVATTVTITDPAPVCTVLVNVNVSAATTIGGSEGSASATASGVQGNVSYLWSNGATTAAITGLPTNTYTVTVTDDITGSCTASQTVLVTDPSVTVSCTLVASATATSPSASGASNGSVTAASTGSQGNVSYVWSNGAATQAATGLAAGIYTVTVTDDITAGCVSTASVTVVDPVASCNLLATFAGTDATTNGGTDGSATATLITSTGNVTYVWSNGGATASITGLSAGTYMVTVTDDVTASCTQMGSVVVGNPAAVTCNIGGGITPSNVTTNGGSDGSAVVVATGTQGNITYVWSNAATTASITGLTAGTYTVTVMDDILANCTAVVSTTITEPAAISCTIAVTASAVAGVATATVTGAQGTVTYLWSTGGTASSESGLADGSYSVTVTDDILAGCTATVTVVVAGIENLSNSVGLNIYPNPSNGNFVVTLSKEGNYSVVVRNVIGQTVENVALYGTTQEISLNANSGIYFVTIKGEGFEKTEKIIVR